MIAQGDEVEKFILLSHGHDGSLAVRVGFTPVRVVCQNTLSMAHGSDASKLIRIKHTKDVHENLANIREVMDLANAEFEATAEQYRLPGPQEHQPGRPAPLRQEGPQGRRRSGRQHPAEEHHGGDRRTGRGGPWQRTAVRQRHLWTAYNGVAEWLGYQRGNSQDNRLNALWFGDGANLNRHALETALEMAV